MYPEVHTLASATLCWSGVETQGSPNATKASPYSPRAFPPKGKPSIHYRTLRVVTEPAQSLGQSPQLNWRLPINRHKGLHLRNLHNLIGGPKNTTKTTKPSRVQRPKRNKLREQAPEVNISRTFTSTYHRGEVKPMHLMQWQEHHKDAQILLSQIPTKLQKLLGE